MMKTCQIASKLHRKIQIVLHQDDGSSGMQNIVLMGLTK